jgi:murein tripeptide amidase MpaA
MLEDLRHIQEERLGDEFENFRPQDTPASGDDFSETEEQHDEQPGSKVYKKKGQKRQTRRVKSEHSSHVAFLCLVWAT